MRTTTDFDRGFREGLAEAERLLELKARVAEDYGLRAALKARGSAFATHVRERDVEVTRARTFREAMAAVRREREALSMGLSPEDVEATTISPLEVIALRDAGGKS